VSGLSDPRAARVAVSSRDTGRQSAPQWPDIVGANDASSRWDSWRRQSGIYPAPIDADDKSPTGNAVFVSFDPKADIISGNDSRPLREETERQSRLTLHLRR